MKTRTQATNQSNRAAKMAEDFQRESVRRAEEELEQAVESVLGRAGKSAEPVEVPSAQPLHRMERPQPAAGRSVIKLGLDVDKQRVTVATQYDNGMIKPAAAFKLNQLVAWVRERVQEGHVVWTVYEACGFGYTLHWKLTEAGAHSLVIAPVRLDTQRRRKTDGLDARQLCGRLTRYLDGQKHELPVIRVPSVQEQQQRETGRQRLFWRSEVQRLASHGRALRLEHEHEGLAGRWWTARNWKKLAPEITPFVREMLERLRPQLESAEQQVQDAVMQTALM
jgi:hypothetical protein